MAWIAVPVVYKLTAQDKVHIKRRIGFLQLDDSIE